MLVAMCRKGVWVESGNYLYWSPRNTLEYIPILSIYQKGSDLM